MVRFRSWLWVLILSAVLIGPLAAYPAAMLADLPDPAHDTSLPQSILIYDRHGTLITEQTSNGVQHVVLTLSEMGPVGPAATLAAEDRNFYSHGPIDGGALIRTTAADLAKGEAAAGGSTITQQLVKIQLLTPAKSVSRKVKEAYLAWAMERKYTKDQILEMYLNRAYFGHNAYGLGAAAKVYFGVNAQDLTVAQAALLAGLLEAPSGDDPATNWAVAHSRELYVIDGLASMGKITTAQADAARAENVQAELHFNAAAPPDLAPHFVDHVLAEVEQKLGPAAMQNGGLSIYTTLDLGLQQEADQAVTAGVQDLAGKGVNNGDLLAADPQTGAILAWVGSADYGSATIGGQFDVVTAPRQPGSSFKPYVYEAALRDQKITLCSTVSDSPTSFGGYSPMDWDRRFMGPMTARNALLLSRNVPAVQVGQMEGIPNVVNVAHAMGVSADLHDYPSTAIGTSEETMVDQVQGYQTFADNGVKVPLVSVTRVVDTTGAVLLDQPVGSQPSSPVLTPAQAYLIQDTLKNYQNQWSLGWNTQMAGKSGTSDGGAAGGNPDAWMMAFNPHIVIGTWGGNTLANGAGPPTSAYGTDVGKSILRRFINGLPSSFAGWYTQPAGITVRDGIPFLSGTEAAATTCNPAPPERGGGDQGGGKGGDQGGGGKKHGHG